MAFGAQSAEKIPADYFLKPAAYRFGMQNTAIAKAGKRQGADDLSLMPEVDREGFGGVFLDVAAEDHGVSGEVEELGGGSDKLSCEA